MAAPAQSCACELQPPRQILLSARNRLTLPAPQSLTADHAAQAGRVLLGHGGDGAARAGRHPWPPAQPRAGVLLRDGAAPRALPPGGGEHPARRTGSDGRASPARTCRQSNACAAHFAPCRRDACCWCRRSFESAVASESARVARSSASFRSACGTAHGCAELTGHWKDT